MAGRDGVLCSNLIKMLTHRDYVCMHSLIIFSKIIINNLQYMGMGNYPLHFPFGLSPGRFWFGETIKGQFFWCISYRREFLTLVIKKEFHAIIKMNLR